MNHNNNKQQQQTINNINKQITGYANRFKEMLKYLHLAGDDFEIFTADKDPNPPKDYLGYPITTVRGFEFPLYKHVTLTFDLSISLDRIVKRYKPDIIHCASPSCVINPVVAYAAHYNIPLLLSYHTDLTMYAKAYASYLPGINSFVNLLIRLYHARADLVLATSPQLKGELEANGVRRVDVWQKGINTEVLLIILLLLLLFYYCSYFPFVGP
jgi:sulfoquinovosyltransferase